jgi:hypothetical protein
VRRGRDSNGFVLHACYLRLSQPKRTRKVATDWTCEASSRLRSLRELRRARTPRALRRPATSLFSSCRARPFPFFRLPRNEGMERREAPGAQPALHQECRERGHGLPRPRASLASLAAFKRRHERKICSCYVLTGILSTRAREASACVSESVPFRRLRSA